jgi:hypothetical protein
MLMLAYR